MVEIDLLNKRLKDVKEAFDSMKKVGVSDEILIVYIMHKTKLPRKRVEAMLNAQEEFYTNLVKTEVAKKV
jgi:hypothetical protein